MRGENNRGAAVEGIIDGRQDCTDARIFRYVLIFIEWYVEVHPNEYLFPPEITDIIDIANCHYVSSAFKHN
jgi:hypothetical protein